MKPLVIIIPGSKVKNPPFSSKLVTKYCSYFGIDQHGDHLFNSLKKNIQQQTNFDVEIFEWSGGITEILSIKPAARNLAQVIKKNKDRSQIIIFAKSLGGRIGELAIKYTHYQPNIAKMIYVASPHSSPCKKMPKFIKIINIYSPADNYIRFANKILYLNFKKPRLTNAQNIVLQNLRHSAFNSNTSIIFEGKEMTLFKVYKNAIVS